MDNIEIENTKYNILIFDNKELKQYIKTKSKIFINYEKAIKEYRELKNFNLEHLLKETYKNMNVIYLIIYKNDTYKNICSMSRLYYKNKTGYINMVYTAPNYRGKGLCYNNLKILMSLKKLNKYNLDVKTKNIAAINCYKKLGFIEVKLTKNVYTMELQKI